MINENKRIQSVERAFSILEEISTSNGGVRLVDLEIRMGLHKSTLHGLLNTLAAMGYVSRSGVYYTLGLRLREIAQPLAESDALIKSEFAQILRNATQISGESCYLAVPCGTREYIYIDTMNTIQNGGTSLRGRREGLTTSAIGKIFLAHRADLTKSLRRAGLMPAHLESELSDIVKQGYAVDLEDAEAGLNCLALPLRQKGCVTAALGIAGPAQRFCVNEMRSMAAAIMRYMLDNVKHD